MGRSKSKRDSLQTVSSPKTPTVPVRKSTTPRDENTTTPGKNSMKRPLPPGSDSEEEDVGLSVAESIENGFPKCKKGKFAILPEDTNDESVEDESDDDDTPEDSDADIAEEDDDDEEEEDDEEEDDDDEDDDDEDDEEEDSVKENVNKKVMPGKLTPSATSLKAKSKPKCQPESTSQQAFGTQKDPEHSFLLIPNGPKDLQKLKKLFTDIGHPVEDIQPLRLPLTLVTLSKPDSAASVVSAQKPLSVDGHTVHAIRLDGVTNSSFLTHGTATSSIFITGIPKSVTLELLKSKLPSNCTPDSTKLLQTGPKNRHFNAAYFNFSTAELATAALKALSQVRLDGQLLRVTYGREMTDNLRGFTKTLLASQLPPNVTEAQLKSIFTTATGFKMITRSGETVCYLSFPTTDAATQAFDAHSDGRVGKSKLMLRFSQDRDQGDSAITAEAWGAPANASVAEILAVFPGASNAYRHARGYFVVQFPSDKVRASGASGKKTVKGNPLSVYVNGGLHGTTTFLKNLPFDASADDVRKVYPNASKVEVHMKPNGLSYGTATLEFASASDASEALQAQHELKGRRIFLSLKRVEVTASEKPAVSVKGKKSNQTESAPKHIPPQVGSASEEDESSGENDDDKAEDTVMQSAKSLAKNTKFNSKPKKTAIEDDDDDEDDEDDEGDDDEDDDDEDDDDEDVDDEDDDEDEDYDENEEKNEESDSDEDEVDAGSDEGSASDSDEEMVPVNKKAASHQSAKQGFKKGNQVAGGDFKRGGGNVNRGGGDFKRGNFNRGGNDFKRGGDFRRGNNFNRGGGDFKRGGGGGDFKRGGRGFDRRGGGFKNRGGGGRGGGGFRGRGGDRGRGNRGRHD